MTATVIDLADWIATHPPAPWRTGTRVRHKWLERGDLIGVGWDCGAPETCRARDLERID